MDFLHILGLALIQGLTEFLPISSSAHLVLPAQLLGWEDQGLAFDVAVHFGTLIAVLAYFRVRVLGLASAWLGSFSGHRSPESHLGWMLLLATMPALVVGFLFGSWIEEHSRSVLVIAATTILFGLLLQYADWRHDGHRTIWMVRRSNALVIGFAQVLALIPGTSRSGITITAGLMLGLSRKEASEFSFLMAIPVISAAALYKSLGLFEGGHTLELQAAGLGIIIAAAAAFACIHVFMKLVVRVGMLPFTIYRLILGFVLLGFAFS